MACAKQRSDCYHLQDVDDGPIIHLWNGSRVYTVCTECTVEQYQCKRNSRIMTIWRWWWRHQMETFSALLAICAGNSPHKGQWHGALMFSLICAWINRWVNNREAGDLRRNCAHYDVIVMDSLLSTSFQNYFISANAHVSIPRSIVQFVLEIRRLAISNAVI